jgi:hypothetical protein
MRWQLWTVTGVAKDAVRPTNSDIAPVSSTQLLAEYWLQSKIQRKTCHEDQEGEQRYSSTLSSTSELDRGGWSTPRPGRFPPGKDTRHLTYMRLGGHRGRTRKFRKISPPTGIRAPKRPDRIEPLHRLRYPGPRRYIEQDDKCQTPHDRESLFTDLNGREVTGFDLIPNDDAGRCLKGPKEWIIRKLTTGQYLPNALWNFCTWACI